LECSDVSAVVGLEARGRHIRSGQHLAEDTVETLDQKWVARVIHNAILLVHLRKFASLEAAASHVGLPVARLRAQLPAFWTWALHDGLTRAFATERAAAASARRVVQAWRKMKRNRPRCGAKRRDGHPCQALVATGPDGEIADRCRLHGGLSTGPRTSAGRARALANLKQFQSRAPRADLPR
jgi:hypothetical protein